VQAGGGWLRRRLPHARAALLARQSQPTRDAAAGHPAVRAHKRLALALWPGACEERRCALPSHPPQPADSLEIYKDDEYIIGDKDLLVNRCSPRPRPSILTPCSFISVPRDLGTLNCGAFVAGVVHGVLDAAGFPAAVSAYSAPVEGSGLRTNILMKFEPSVLERESRLG